MRPAGRASRALRSPVMLERSKPCRPLEIWLRASAIWSLASVRVGPLSARVSAPSESCPAAPARALMPSESWVRPSVIMSTSSMSPIMLAAE